MTKVSVIIATYKPVLERLLFSIDSVVRQQGIDFELIITDDGSINNCFEEARAYIEKKGFQNYTLLSHEKNAGTVKNILDAVYHAKGQYVRTIGTGDALYGTTSLKDHVDFLEKSKRKWSFGQMIYFTIDDSGKREYIRHQSRPQLTKSYLEGNDKKCMRQYCTFRDVATGTAILYEKNTIREYLELIQDKVIYCEDYIGEIMTYDGLVAAYYPEPVVLYEFAAGGVTDQTNRGWQDWREKIMNDIAAADLIMISRDNTPDDSLHRKINRIHRRRNRFGRSKLCMIFEPGRILFHTKRILHPSMTNIPIDEMYLKTNCDTEAR